MTTNKTCSTHVTEAPDPALRYYVIDDAREVFGANLPHRDALITKDRVAGNLWSRTPRLEPMPTDVGQATAIIEAAAKSTRGIDPPKAAPPAAPAATLAAPIEITPPAPAVVVANTTAAAAVIAADPGPADAQDPIAPSPLEDEPLEELAGDDEPDDSALADL